MYQDFDYLQAIPSGDLISIKSALRGVIRSAAVTPVSVHYIELAAKIISEIVRIVDGRLDVVTKQAD